MLQHIAKNEKLELDDLEDFDSEDENEDIEEKEDKEEEKKSRKKDEDDDDDDEEENILDNFHFDDDDDLDLNFDDEELADEQELKDINDKKAAQKQQLHPFDDISLDIVDDNNLNTVDNDDDENNQSDIIKMDSEIDNINMFIKHMENKGYQFESSRFLTKKFAEASDEDYIYNINITISDEVVTAITAYDEDNKIVAIPSSISDVIKKDIDDSLKEYL